MSINDYIKHGKLNTTLLKEVSTNVPSRYSSRRKRYYEDESSRFLYEYAKYSSDFFDAEIQGLYEDDFYKWRTCRIRMADIVTASASMSRTLDNYKNIIIADLEIDYIPRGAKIYTMGSYWIVVNPFNISGGDGNAIIQRCDAAYNYLDYYGNVRSEPICIDDLTMNANDNDSQRSTMITKGYFNVTCQYNDVTRQLDNNARIILGRDAYRITGFSNFTQEFTGDYDSVRIMGMTIRYEEINSAIDDVENKVAGGKTFEWNIGVSGNKSIRVGETSPMSVESKRRFGEKTTSVSSSEEYPIEYEWSSSDESIATVSSQGDVYGVSEGEAIIYTTLKQNPLKTAATPIIIEGDVHDSYIMFTSEIPDVLRLFESTVITAAYYENGNESDTEISWKVYGEKEAFTYTVDNNSITVKCWQGSVEKIKVIAECNGDSEEVEIELEGL